MSYRNIMFTSIVTVVFMALIYNSFPDPLTLKKDYLDTKVKELVMESQKIGSIQNKSCSVPVNANGVGMIKLSIDIEQIFERRKK